MADKNRKSQAQQKASSAKNNKKNTASKKTREVVSVTGKKPVTEQKQSKFPPRLISSVAFLGMFV